MREVLKAENLSKIFTIGSLKIEAVANIDLTVNEGDFVSIMGPSGCGKSTLLYMLGGLTKVSKGNLFVDENNVTRYSLSKLAKMRRKKIGFVFQTLNLLPSLSVLNNIKIAMSIFHNKKDVYNPVELLERFGLQKKLHRYPRELSYGERQRVAIARALVHKPDIILADEPTGNLDSVNTQNVLDLLSELNKENNQTIVLITHEQNVADAAHRTVHMKDGCIDRITT